MTAIPRIGAEAALAGTADAALAEAAAGSGFLTVTGVDRALDLSDELRARLLAFFSMPGRERMALARRKFAPGRPNVYRGYFPPQKGEPTYKEGIEIGPDLLDPSLARPGDPLTEPTPLPPEDALPGWRDDATRYYRAMDRLGRALLAGLARGLGLDAKALAGLFDDGISTLRLLNYPERPADSLPDDLVEVAIEGDSRWIVGRAHCDSGFVTLLWQDSSGGLQAKTADGAWIDVPPEAGGLAVNFGRLLSDLSQGRVRATEHRVLGGRAARASIPFFLEPAVDAPIRVDGATVPYGDLLWRRMTAFVEFRGVARVPAEA